MSRVVGSVSGNIVVRTFLHIPKTGGTTFRHIFNDDCSNKGMKTFVFMSQMVDNTTTHVDHIKTLILHDNIRCLYGHLSWAVLKQINIDEPTIEFDIFVMLREPVPRAISHYIYNVKARNETRHYGLFFEEYSNHITNYLYDSQVGPEEVLISQIHYIGITDLFHETLAYLVAIGYLENAETIVYYKSRKVNSDKYITDDMWDSATEQNIVDQELYEIAMDIFMDQIEGMSEEQLDVYQDIIEKIYLSNHDCEDDDINVGSGKCW